MTPAARVAATINLLDEILAGAPVEQTLTTWARRNRYAGSGDRAAIRDLVFDALRRRRSYAARGGADSGRGLMIGAARDKGLTPDEWFSGARFAPQPLSPQERANERQPTQAEALDCPDWLVPHFQVGLGSRTSDVLEAQRHRAPVYLRVAAHRMTVPEAVAHLAEDDITASPIEGQALQVTDGARRIARSAAYLDGLVELQDLSSQLACARLPVPRSGPVLDFCAGGGGKALALAARGASVWAHDVNPARMTDLPIRATRAQSQIRCVKHSEIRQAGAFPLVVVDAPCSGSGTWRRQPGMKWRLTESQLAGFCETQSRILRDVADLVAPGGHLAYMTCSLLERENSQQIKKFQSDLQVFSCVDMMRWTPLEGGDGFFLAVLRRDG